MKPIHYVLFFLLAAPGGSCKKTGYSTWISLKNETGDTLQCEFFPAKGANGYVLDATMTGTEEQAQAYMYSAGNMEISPVDLINLAYDSLVIRVGNESKTVLIFTKNAVIDYKHNPFKEENLWQSENFEVVEQTSLSKHIVKVTNYYFCIKEEDIVP